MQPSSGCLAIVFYSFSVHVMGERALHVGGVAALLCVCVRRMPRVELQLNLHVNAST